MERRRQKEYVDLNTFGGRLYAEIMRLFGSVNRMSEKTGLHTTELQRWASNTVIPKIDKLTILEKHGLDIVYLISGKHPSAFQISYPEWAIPVYKFTSPTRGGVWNMVDDNYITEYLPLWMVKDIKSPVMVDVVGVSMSPEIDNKDTVIFDTVRKAKHKDIIICTYEGDTMIKRLSLVEGNIELLSSNKKYKPITMNDTLTIHGVVVRIIKNIAKNK